MQEESEHTNGAEHWQGNIIVQLFWRLHLHKLVFVHNMYDSRYNVEYPPRADIGKVAHLMIASNICHLLSLYLKSIPKSTFPAIEVIGAGIHQNAQGSPREWPVVLNVSG